ncbi:MAG TPA: hemerythrin domain-containing protein [Myxococcales bacterium]|jgi:iron-sulfur cluster repair protein YtfE (RIC family)|nr:hemerythrin domain-containing protein [Myxococcales bacterium]
MMNLGNRRSVLLSQHRHLRQLIRDLREVAASVQISTDDLLGERAAALAAFIGRFGNELRAHLATEEELLGPVLERVDAWGALRLELMRAEHAHQRAVLDALRTDRNMGAKEMAKRAWSLTADVLEDMEAEEIDLFGEHLLGAETALTR